MQVRIKDFLIVCAGITLTSLLIYQTRTKSAYRTEIEDLRSRLSRASASTVEDKSSQVLISSGGRSVSTRRTPEETEAILENGRKLGRGEYVLKSEQPLLARLSREAAEAGAISVGEEVTRRQVEKLQALNVSPEIIRQLTNHCSKIVKASHLCDAPLLDLMMARRDYDVKAKQLLTDEQYRQYREFETVMSVERAFSTTLFGYEGYDPVKLAETIQSLKIDSPNHNRLSYQAIPEIEFGGTEWIPRLKSRAENYASRIEAVASMRSGGTLPELVANQLIQYLEGELRSTQTTIEMLAQDNTAGREDTLASRPR